MREDLLHYIWKHGKLRTSDLLTSRNETLTILDLGLHNHLSGPDFFNAKLEIDGQVWAGNVEIHLKSSDWYVHRHEHDSKYDNVILHVVWEDDVGVFRKDGSEIPTLELHKYVSPKVLKNYHDLFSHKNQSFINCENDVGQVEAFLMDNWLERLYFERLEQKSDVVLDLLEESKNDWEKVFFVLLLKGFGLKINGDPFLNLGKALDFSIVRKMYGRPLQLEAILLGMAGLLEQPSVLDEYYINLKKEYGFLKNKFSLTELPVQRPEFFKLRPANFPTIRLSQIANIYATRQNLFSSIAYASSLNDIREKLNVSASIYWTTHYTFGKSVGKSAKILSKKFIDLLIINTVIPIKFCYASYKGMDLNEEITNVVSNLVKERNSIVGGFEKHGVPCSNAMESQALIQLYNEYCTKNRCMQCAVGSQLLMN